MGAKRYRFNGVRIITKIPINAPDSHSCNYDSHATMEIMTMMTNHMWLPGNTQSRGDNMSSRSRRVAGDSLQRCFPRLISENAQNRQLDLRQMQAPTPKSRGVYTREAPLRMAILRKPASPEYTDLQRVA